MSQNSLVLPTSGTLSGLSAVQDMNAALDTLNTLASGASAPSSPEVGQLWHDTLNAILKLRSMDNTSWINLMSLDETNYLATPRLAPVLYGLMLSNDATTANTVIDIAPGGAVDTTATYSIRLPSVFKKSFASTFTAGSGNGGLDTGSLAASTGYHVHLIYNPTSHAVDVIGSLSYSSPGLPSGFTAFIPIGGFTTDSSAHIRAFVQNGNEFLYPSGVQDVNSVSVPTSPTLVNTSVPTGFKVNGLYRVSLFGLDSSSQPTLLLQSPDETAFTPATSSPSSFSNVSLTVASNNVSNEQVAAGEFNIRTNTSGQIRVVAALDGGGPVTYSVYTRGFVYPRGLQ